jgi:hypothetical protein
MPFSINSCSCWQGKDLQSTMITIENQQAFYQDLIEILLEFAILDEAIEKINGFIKLFIYYVLSLLIQWQFSV